jgi:hypothetical protein
MTTMLNGTVENAPPKDHKSFILGMITPVPHGKEKSGIYRYICGRIRVKGIPSQSIGRRVGVRMESPEKEALPMEDLKEEAFRKGIGAEKTLEQSGSTTTPVNVVNICVQA